MLTITEAIFLGFIQGVSEWLPISSEGMISLVMINIFGKTLSEAIPFAIWLHIGTLLAASVYFRKDLLSIIRKLPDYIMDLRSGHRPDPMITFLAVSTMLTGIIGLALMLYVLEALTLDGRLATALIGGALIFTGLLQRMPSTRYCLKEEPGIRDSSILGLVQGLSIIPGVSRSGITVSALLLRGFKSSDALRLSFIMSIPTVLAAQIGLNLLDPVSFSAASLFAVLVSFITGLVSISALVRIADKVNFSTFCIALGFLSMMVLII